MLIITLIIVLPAARSALPVRPVYWRTPAGWRPSAPPPTAVSIDRIEKLEIDR